MTAAGGCQDLACRCSASSRTGDTSHSGAATSRRSSTTGSAGGARSSSGTVSPACAVDDEVHVELEGGGERRFDLVIGADGLHSRVRKLVFGPQDRYEKDLGYRVAAFETTGYRPRDELVYIIHGAPG